MARSYYDVMMISPLADRELITAVYRHLAKRYHPDRTSSPTAAARMAELNEAYSVLSDRTRRARYDETLGHGDIPVGSADPPPPAPTPDGIASGTFERGHGDAGPPPQNPAPVGSALTFGRYRGWSLNQVGRYDRDYLEWLSRTTMGRTYRQELDDLLRRRR